LAFEAGLAFWAGGEAGFASGGGFGWGAGFAAAGGTSGAGSGELCRVLWQESIKITARINKRQLRYFFSIVDLLNKFLSAKNVSKHEPKARVLEISNKPAIFHSKLCHSKLRPIT
jgi:hypothetical protein